MVRELKITLIYILSPNLGIYVSFLNNFLEMIAEKYESISDRLAVYRWSLNLEQ